MRFFSRLVAAGVLLAAVCLPSAWAALARPALLYPADGATVRTNMPALAWSAPDAATCEVTIDGHPAGALPASVGNLVTFPLSFGEHHWTVTAVRDGERVVSAEGRFTADDAPLQQLPEGARLLRYGWAVQSSVIAGLDGAKLSAPGVDVSGWATTSVPATVLTALVRNGVYPNPYVGLNNTRIPDANDAFNAKQDLLRFSHLPGKNPWAQPYWYRTTFRLPAEFAGRRVWLALNEINYRAEVWCNGVKLGDRQELVGMDRPFRFDVTALAHRDAENVVAVAIYPLDEPGEPEPPPVTALADPGRNMGADAVISHTYSKWDTIGWDWQPEVHDRDMGITEDVFIYATDDAELADVYVTSDLPLPDISQADLTVAFDVSNHAKVGGTAQVHGVIRDPAGRAVEFKHELALAGGATHVEWTPKDVPELHVGNPSLWWPNGLGAPNLYTLTLELTTAGGGRSRQEVTFGIRKFESYRSGLTGSRAFRVNGRTFFAQGGNWVIDMMLNGTASRYEQEIELTRRANLNFLRVWGPTGAPPDAFYAAADRAGVLIWQDFLHDHWGTEQNQPGFEPPLALFEAATSAIIRKYRNHASLFLWCGGNEGPNPREDLIKNHLLPALDPRGSRFYLTGSIGDGVMGGGPYHTMPPRDYFGHPKSTNFNSEVGPSGVPDWESIAQFLPAPSAWAKDRFPLDGAWAYHDATDRGDQRKFSFYDTLLRSRYGAGPGLDGAAAEDYVRTAQAVNYDALRAAIEAINRNRWTQATGFALWKFNSSWPSVIWQLSDWYLRANSGYFAARRACEPVHVQFNADDRTLAVVNRTGAALDGCTLEAELLDLRAQKIWSQRETVALPADGTLPTKWTVPVLLGIQALKLRLLDAHGALLSDNLYWLGEKDDLTALRGLPTTTVTATVAAANEARTAYTVTLRNGSATIARLVRARLLHAGTEVEVLPNLWSDNYVTLLPGESATLRVDVPAGVEVAQPEFEITGRNVAKQKLRP